MNTVDICNCDKPKEECGVFAIYGKDPEMDVTALTNYALFALQHRGQQSCGIAVNDNGTIIYHKNLGLVSEVFDKDVMSKLKGQMAVGHVRYSTSFENTRENAQPLVTKYVKGTLTIAHNGILTNSKTLRNQLEKEGCLFQGTNDTEVVAYLIAKERLNTRSVEDAVCNAMDKISGAYAFVVMSPTKIIAGRDPLGLKPLSLGKLGDSYIVASETVAFDAIGAEFVRDIDPGEVIVITKDGVRVVKEGSGNKGKMCIFEYIYFARPDSVIEGSSVYESRKEAGKYLARQNNTEADVVIAVPDSGIAAAIGYAEESGLPYEVGLMKNRYIARTFIQPTQKMRENAVRIKLNAIKNVVNGKRVIMVDDSIVRGTTSKRIVKLLREAGATEVHMKISSPPFLYPCYFGTDVGSQDELVAVGRTVEEICEMTGADSLDYLSLDNLMKTPIGARCGFCTSCFDGKYPMDIKEMAEKDPDDKRIFIKNLE